MNETSSMVEAIERANQVHKLHKLVLFCFVFMQCQFSAQMQIPLHPIYTLLDGTCPTYQSIF